MEIYNKRQSNISLCESFTIKGLNNKNFIIVGYPTVSMVNF